jgi:hypothetical protein
MSQEFVAEEMGWAESKLYRIENDKSRILQRDVKRLIRLYAVEEEQSEVLIELARLAAEPDWWHQYSGAIPEWFHVYVVLESSSTEINGYESELVPGIMQSEGYARAIMSTAPAPYSDEDLESTVTVRSNRQSRLTGDNPLKLWLVINEAVIRRVVGGREVMREQIQHVIKVAGQKNVTLQVLPFSVGEHGAMLGAFNILKFADPSDPDKVYMENHIGALYTQKEHEVDRYRLMFDHLRAQALGPDQTLNLLRAVAADLAS